MKRLFLIFLAVSFNASAQMTLGPPHGYSSEPFCNYSSICVKGEIWQLREGNGYYVLKNTVAKWAIYDQGWENKLVYVMQDIVLFSVYKQGYGKKEVLLKKIENGSWSVIEESKIVY